MKLDRTLVLAMGLAAAGLLTLGLTLETEPSPTPGRPGPPSPPAGQACVAVVAEHAACALPPRHAEHGGPPPASRVLR